MLTFKSFKSPDARMIDQVKLSSEQLKNLDVSKWNSSCICEVKKVIGR